MTVNNLIDKLIKYFSWLYFRHWERWELLIIVLICLVLLLLIIWQQQKGTTKSVYVNQVRERSPIIGVKLADNRSHLKIEDLKKDRSASLPKNHTKQKETKEQLEKLNEQIQQLQLEISKHKQIEVRLEQHVTELTAANEKLQHKAAVNNQVKQQARKQIGELTASKKQSIHRTNARKQSDRILREKTEKVRVSKELREQPLDVQKLKAIAELAKQIQRRPRQ